MTGDVLYATLFYILIVVMIYVSYGTFAAVVLRWCKKPIQVRNKKKEAITVQPTLDISEKIKCYIPFWQPLEVQKALFNTYGFYLPVQLIGTFMFLAGIIIVWFIPVNSYVMFYAHIALIVGYIIQKIVYGIITSRCAYLYGFNWLVMIGSFIFPIIFCLWLKNRIPAIMLDKQKTTVFEEVKDDTIIKQKSHKRKNTTAVSKS